MKRANLKLTNIRLSICLAAAAGLCLFSHPVLYAGWKSGGDYQIVDDIISSGGSEESTGGSYTNQGNFVSFSSGWTLSSPDGTLVGGFLPNVNYAPIVDSLVSPLDGEDITDTTPTLEWTYSDFDENTQRGYAAEVSAVASFSSIITSIQVEDSSVNTWTTGELVSGNTYYWRAKVKDAIWNEWGNWSSARTFYVEPLEPPGTITTLSALTNNANDGRIDLEWTSVGGNSYQVRYSTKSLSDFAGNTTQWWNNAAAYTQNWVPDGIGTQDNESVILGVKKTYYLSIRAYNGFLGDIGNVAGPVLSGDKVPDDPVGLSLSLEDSYSKIRLNWTANSEPDISRYIIKRSSTGVNGTFVFISSVTHPLTTYLDSQVEYERTYTYRLWVIDNTGNISAGYDEDTIEVRVDDEKLYADIDIIEIVKNSSSKMTFGWPQVTIDSNAESKKSKKSGRAVTMPKGYIIERAGDLTKGWERVSGLIYSTETLKFTVPVKDKVYYYRVITVSPSGKKSPGCLAIDTSEERNHIYCSRDMNAWVEIPDSFIDELYAYGNQIIKLDLKKYEDDAEDFLLCYDVKAMGGRTKIEDFIFKKTRLGPKVQISYQHLSEKGSISNIQAAGDLKLAMFWFNGIEWIKLGGVNDTSKGRTYTRARRLGKYGIKFARLADKFTLNTVYPRIFTPDLPSEEEPIVNDTKVSVNSVHFFFENPNFAEVTIKIFDITGAEVKRNLRREGENSMVWDGRDDDGNVVRGGIYIYQIESDGEVINGTIVVAK
ncbi:MAG: hypothetical protein JXJ19_09980 [Elusimicrobia bacterium]|nr:hypothetical protein [Elusimicrobiota bacterium]